MYIGSTNTITKIGSLSHSRCFLLALLTAATGAIQVVSGAAPQRTFFVAPQGNDKNPGTEANPFATPQRAQQEVRKVNRSMSGDILVVLRGGTYRIGQSLVFDDADSGTGGHSVIYQAAAGESPVFSGGAPITGWQPDSNGIWKAKTDIPNFRQLYVNGSRAVRAKGGALPGATLTGTNGYLTTAVAMADWRNPADIEFCYFTSWCLTRCKVSSITREGSNALVNMLQPQFTIARRKEGKQVDLPSYIENALELLDQPGEWYLDRPAKTVFCFPKPGEEMGRAQVVAPAVEQLMVLRGTLDRPVHHIQFVGITFADAGWLRPSEVGLVDVQANFVLQGTNILERDGHLFAMECTKSPANVVVHAAKAIRFERCIFTRLGGAGLDLEFGAQDNVIQGCTFFDISGSAIQVGDVLKDDHHPEDPRMIVKNNAVLNNYIHDACVEFLGGVGVFAGYTEGTVIAHNEITRLPYSGISVGWGWGEVDAGGGVYKVPFIYQTPTPSKNNCVEYNHIHRVLERLQDGAGVYALGNMPGTIIRGNNIHDNPSWPGGIYLDEGSGFIEVTSNLVNKVGGQPLNFNNSHQKRNETCKVHDNFIGVTNAQIAGQAGLEPSYRDLLTAAP